MNGKKRSGEPLGRQAQSWGYGVAVPIARPEAGVPVALPVAGVPVAPPGTLVVDDEEAGMGVTQLGVGDGVLVPAAVVLAVVGLDVDVPEAKRVGVGVQSGGVAERDGAAAGVVPSELGPAALGVRLPLGDAAGVPAPLDAAPGVVEPTSASPGVLVPISPRVGMVTPAADIGAGEVAPAGVVALPVVDPVAHPAATKAITKIAATVKTNLISILSLDYLLFALIERSMNND